MFAGANGQIELLGDRVVIHRRGLEAKIYHAFKGQKSIPLAAISAIQAREPGVLMPGYIQFTIAGGVESRRGVWEAVKDENTVVFRFGDRDSFRACRTSLDEAISKAQAPKVTLRVAPPLASQPSVTSELAKLAELKASGILTEEEFQSLKRNIIAISGRGSQATETANLSGNSDTSRHQPDSSPAAIEAFSRGVSPSANVSSGLADHTRNIAGPAADPVDDAAAAPAVPTRETPSRWRMAYWVLILPILLIIAATGTKSGLVVYLLLLGIIVVGFVKPLPSLGIRKPVSIAAIILCLLMAPLVIPKVLNEKRLTDLRASDPQTYLREIAESGSVETYLAEMKALDPGALDALIAKREERYMLALKEVDPTRYKIETDKIAAEEAEKRAIQQAKAEAERLQKEIAEKQRLEKLRASDPKAYLDAIKGTQVWEAEFRALDPKGYAAWQQEQIKAKISDYAYDPYTKDQYPKTFANWGSAGVKKINALRKQAAFLVALNSACDHVDVSDLSDQRSVPGKKIVIFIDCVNHQRFYMSEEEIKAGTKPVSKNQKTALISDASAMQACEAQVKAVLHFPSTFDRSLLSGSVFRSEYGNIAVEFDFEAMNGLGNVLPQSARCIIDDQGIHPAEISNR